METCSFLRSTLIPPVLLVAFFASSVSQPLNVGLVNKTLTIPNNDISDSAIVPLHHHRQQQQHPRGKTASTLTVGQAKLSTEGRRFLVYPSRVERLWDRVQIYVTTQSASPVTVRVYSPLRPAHRGGVDVNGSVQSGQPFVTKVTGVATNIADILHDGLLVVADKDVAVFVNNPSSNASGVTSILADDCLGMDYLFPSINRVHGAQVSILVGSADARPNEVTVTLPPGPTTPTLQWKGTLYTPGQSFRFNLNQHEFTEIRQEDGSGSGDLTGTLIHSRHPLAVFSASVFYPLGSPYPPSSKATDKDITIENIPPTGSLGQSFVVSATPAASKGDHIRVIAGQPAAHVNISSDPALTLLPRQGDFFEREIMPWENFILQSDVPVQVIQYRYKFTVDSAPFMFLVPAIESYGSAYTVPIIFEDFTHVQGSGNFVVLTTHACYADRVIMQHDTQAHKNGLVSTLSSWQRVGNSGYVTSRINVGAGFVSVKLLASDRAEEDAHVTVGGFFFGMGPNKAYAAPLGLQKPKGPLIKPVWTMPDPVNAGLTEPIPGGLSTLVTRHRVPLTLPVSANTAKSRVVCLHVCWINRNCFYAAFNKQKGVSNNCLLFASTAECAGLVRRQNYLLYKLHK